MNLAGSVVVSVPVYDEARVLSVVLDGLFAVFPRVVVIDDGSSDESGDLARAAGATVLHHAVNLGAGAALQTGIEYVLSCTSADYVVTFDGDGQHNPTDALAMLGVAVERSLDVVLGSRVSGTVIDQPWARRMLLRASVHFTRWSTGLMVTDTHNGLRVLSRQALSKIRLTHNGMAHASELEATIALHGLAWAEVAVTIAYTDHSRSKGQTNVNAINVLYDLASARLRSPR